MSIHSSSSIHPSLVFPLRGGGGGVGEYTVDRSPGHHRRQTHVQTHTTPCQSAICLPCGMELGNLERTLKKYISTQIHKSWKTNLKSADAMQCLIYSTNIKNIQVHYYNHSTESLNIWLKPQTTSFITYIRHSFNKMFCFINIAILYIRAKRLAMQWPLVENYRNTCKICDKCNELNVLNPLNILHYRGYIRLKNTTAQTKHGTLDVLSKTQTIFGCKLRIIERVWRPGINNYAIKRRVLIKDHNYVFLSRRSRKYKIWRTLSSSGISLILQKVPSSYSRSNKWLFMTFMDCTGSSDALVIKGLHFKKIYLSHYCFT